MTNQVRKKTTTYGYPREIPIGVWIMPETALDHSQKAENARSETALDHSQKGNPNKMWILTTKLSMDMIATTG